MLIGSTISLNTMMLGSTSFTPATLFSRGEQGVWLDPSDVANLNWLVNLLTWTQEFDNVVWLREGTLPSANTAIAPDGTLTAELCAETAVTSTHAITQTITLQATQHVLSVFLKKGTGATAPDWMQVTFGGASTGYANFNLSTGTVGFTSGATATISSVGSGWYRCSVIVSVAAAGAASAQIVFTNNTDTTTRRPSYAGATTSDVLIWGAQIEVGSVTTPYQAITTVNAGVVERFPLNTMFQDRNGTTPVTTPGQLVGLRLDKSQQLAQGPELVANGNFSSGTTTGWTPVNATLSVVNGTLRLTVITSSLGASAGTQISTVVGRTYRLTLTFVADGATGNSFVYLGSTAGGSEYFNANLGSVVGTYTFVFTATATTSFVTVSTSTASLSGETNDWDNFSVREIAGNHATAVSDATRGTYGIEPYGGRRNLLIWTEQFDNPVWTNLVGPKPTVTPNAAVAPDGTLTADLLNFSAQFQAINQGSRTVGTVYTESVWMRVASGTRVINLVNNVGTILGTFTVTSTWQRFSATYTATQIAAGWQDRNVSGPVGVFIWGAQLEIGSILNPYQRVTTEWDVTEAGVPTVHYLEYDNDAYVTPTINPSLNPPLGPELVSNGDFSQGSTGWSVNGGWSISGGSANAAIPSGFGDVRSTYNITTTGRTYRLTFTANIISGGVRWYLGGVTAPATITASGTYSIPVTATEVNYVAFIAYGAGGAFTGSIDNVSVQELVTDEMQIFAGTRKLSDAASGMVAEFSSSIFSFPGAFNLLAPSGAFANYQFSSAGTAIAAVAPTGYTAPISNILTGLGDISADVTTLRVNGVQAATSSADQGTGSYGAYPLYIGARGGSSVFFRGRDYGIIVRFGPNLSNTMILDTEEWLGNKTGVLYVLWNGVWQDQYTWVDNLNWNDGV